jgi:hypothetical protein
LPRPSAIPLTSQIRFIAKIILWQSWWFRLTEQPVLLDAKGEYKLRFLYVDRRCWTCASSLSGRDAV